MKVLIYRCSGFHPVHAWGRGVSFLLINILDVWNSGCIYYKLAWNCLWTIMIISTAYILLVSTSLQHGKHETINLKLHHLYKVFYQWYMHAFFLTLALYSLILNLMPHAPMTIILLCIFNSQKMEAFLNLFCHTPGPVSGTNYHTWGMYYSVTSISLAIYLTVISSQRSSLSDLWQ